jgi:hypothetical protein
MNNLDYLEPVELEALERAAYCSGDCEKAELLGLVAELKSQIEALEEKIEDTVTIEDWERRNGPAEAYKTFFYECFERLHSHYPAPSVISDYDKSVIFEALEMGETVKNEVQA